MNLRYHQVCPVVVHFAIADYRCDVTGRLHLFATFPSTPRPSRFVTQATLQRLGGWTQIRKRLTTFRLLLLLLLLLAARRRLVQPNRRRLLVAQKRRWCRRRRHAGRCCRTDNVRRRRQEESRSATRHQQIAALHDVINLRLPGFCVCLL